MTTPFSFHRVRAGLFTRNTPIILLPGTVISRPTGPTIVLCVRGIVVISLLFAPHRGLLQRRLKQWANRRQLHIDAVREILDAPARQVVGDEAQMRV